LLNNLLDIRETPESEFISGFSNAGLSPRSSCEIQSHLWNYEAKVRVDGNIIGWETES